MDTKSRLIPCFYCGGTGKVKCDCKRRKVIKNLSYDKENTYVSSTHNIEQCKDCGKYYETFYDMDLSAGSSFEAYEISEEEMKEKIKNP